MENGNLNQAKAAMKNSKLKLSEIELELVKKYRSNPPKSLKELKKIAKDKAKFGVIDNTNLFASGYTGQYIKKKALVDKMLVNN